MLCRVKSCRLYDVEPNSDAKFVMSGNFQNVYVRINCAFFATNTDECRIGLKDRQGDLMQNHSHQLTNTQQRQTENFIDIGRALSWACLGIPSQLKTRHEESLSDARNRIRQFAGWAIFYFKQKRYKNAVSRVT